MPRTRGYAAKGERCYGVHDWNAKGRTNAIGAIARFVFLMLGLFESTINSDVFYAWLTQDLLPKVPAGAVIVMDNASFHNHKRIQEIVAPAYHMVIPLPPYSPDFNPIEQTFGAMKKRRKSLPPNTTIDQLILSYN